MATFDSGLGDGEDIGDSSGVGVGVSVGVEDGLGEGVGDVFFFLGLGVTSSSGVGDGDFFCFGFGDTSSSGLGVGDVFCLRGVALGEGLGALFLIVCLWRRRNGVGVGVAKNSLIFSPNDGPSWARPAPGGGSKSRSRSRRKRRCTKSGGKFLQDRFVHLDSILQVLERKVFVG